MEGNSLHARQKPENGKVLEALYRFTKGILRPLWFTGRNKYGWDASSRCGHLGSCSENLCVGSVVLTTINRYFSRHVCRGRRVRSSHIMGHFIDLSQPQFQLKRHPQCAFLRSIHTPMVAVAPMAEHGASYPNSSPSSPRSSHSSWPS